MFRVENIIQSNNDVIWWGKKTIEVPKAPVTAMDAFRRFSFTVNDRLDMSGIAIRRRKE